METKIVRASEIEPKKVRWLWYPYIPFGKITLIQGDPGDGKSTFVLDLLARLGMVGNAKAKENAIELLGRYAPELANVKSNLESTQSYIKILESRLSTEERKVIGRNHQIDEMGGDLFRERRKVNELEHKLKKLERLIDKIPEEMKEELFRKPQERERDAR